MCTCLAEDTRRYVASLFDEHVTDVATRRRLRDSWGLCTAHTWMILDARPTATGVAIVYEDLLRVCRERLQPEPADPNVAQPRVQSRAAELQGAVARLVAALRTATARAVAALREAPGAVTRSRAQIVDHYRRRARCPVCAESLATEAHCVALVVQHAGDPDFDAAYEASHGLCVPHLIATIERSSGRPPVPRTRAGASPVDALVERTLSKWQSLRRDLATFVSKHEYRSDTPFTEAEAMSYQRVLAILAGHRDASSPDTRTP